MYLSIYLSIYLSRCPQWTDDELVCARNVTNEIHFFEGGCPGMYIHVHVYMYVQTDTEGI